MLPTNEGLNNNFSEIQENKNMESKFCSQCGKPLQFGQKFCSACGSQVITENAGNSIQQVYPMDRNSYMQKENIYKEYPSTFSMGMGRLIEKFTYSKSSIVIEAVSIIVDIIVIMLFTYFKMEINSKLAGRIFDFDGTKSALAAFFNFIIVVNFAEIFIHVFKSLTSYKMSLSIFENGISGVGGKNLYFTTETFEVRYSDILNVKIRFGAIIIETTTKTYKCTVTRVKDAYGLLQEHIDNSRC